jgi:hypothetical protein
MVMQACPNGLRIPLHSTVSSRLVDSESLFAAGERSRYDTHAMSWSIIVDNLLGCITVYNLVTAVLYND